MKPRTRQRGTTKRRTAGRLVSSELKGKSSRFYRISAGGAAITCCVCGFTSRDKQHVRDKFCPVCLIFHEDRILMSRLTEGYERQLPAQEARLPRFNLAA